MPSIDATGRLGVRNANVGHTERDTATPTSAKTFSREEKEPSSLDGTRRTVGPRFFQRQTGTPNQANQANQPVAYVRNHVPAPHPGPLEVAVQQVLPSYQQAMLGRPPSYYQAVVSAEPAARQDGPVVPPGLQPLGRR